MCDISLCTRDVTIYLNWIKYIFYIFLFVYLVAFLRRLILLSCISYLVEHRTNATSVPEQKRQSIEKTYSTFN